MTFAARSPTSLSRWRTRLRPRGLLGKYTITLISLVLFVLSVTGGIETWIIYRETRTTLARAQADAADLIARRLDSYLSDLERQISWVTRASATSVADHRADYALLLQQVPVIAGLTYVYGDRTVKLSMRRDTGAPETLDAATIEQAFSRQIWFGPSVFDGNKPFLFLSMAHSGANAGLTIARIDLTALSPLVDTGSAAASSYAYVVDQQRRVLAASRNAPVAVGTSPAADAETISLLASGRLTDHAGTGPGGEGVISTGATVDTTGWFVVVEAATKEALRPISDFLLRLVVLLAFGLMVATLAGLVLARRMIGPIQALHMGAAHLAENRFDHRISVKTGDELEELADQFNRMADDLAESYGRLELKVEERTHDLAQSVRELKALEEIGRALSSSLDIADVLATIVARAVDLVDADAGAIYAHQPGTDVFRLAEAQGFPVGLRESVQTVVRQADGALENALRRGDPISVPDIAAETRFPFREIVAAAGFRSALVVGLLGSGGTSGALVMYRREAGQFPVWTSRVMRTFAHQSVLAMHNAHLFQQLVDKGQQLEIANAHRTQFFANMSHELRTPLNAVLGFSELLADGLYGAIPERALGVLDRIQANGKHLLGLINDVLDVTKMEAGALSLSLSGYSMRGLIENVVASTESLAKTKGLAFESDIADGLPMGHGDERRLSQVLFNLVGNAIKFTDEGSVGIKAVLEGPAFHIAVRDTGPGITPEAQKTIFDEFQQVDDANTRKKGGTGLGLTIASRLVAMHGGHIDVVSNVGEGAVFTVVLPVTATPQEHAS